MYSINQETGPTTKYLDAGITENVKIVDIAAENSKKDGTGALVLRFYFEGENGATFQHTEFAVDPEHLKKMAKSWGADAEELIQNAINDMGARIKHILGAFMPEDQIIIDAKTWEDYISKIVALAGDLYKDVKFRVKLVLNNKDFVIFPKKTYSDFIQNMDVPNTLKIVPKYDRIVPKAPTEEGLYGDEGDDSGILDAEDDFEDEF